MLKLIFKSFRYLKGQFFRHQIGCSLGEYPVGIQVYNEVSSRSEKQAHRYTEKAKFIIKWYIPN